MLYKATALVFILIANTLLLVHIVIPHHHHRTEICVINSHCQTNSEAHTHGTTEHNHRHDNERNFENCAFVQVYLIPFNEVSIKCTYNLSRFDDFQAVLTDKGLYGLFPSIISTDQLLLLASTHSSFASTILGLRAPPVV